MPSRIRSSLLLVAVVVTCCAPMAWAAKPRLYRVSLSGDVRNEQTFEREGDPPPLGCVGSSTVTHHFAASAGLSARPGASPIASYGRLRFRALLTAPTVSSTTSSTGSWAPDPYLPPDDPSACTFRPENKISPCSFAAEATRPSGAELALYPNSATYELYYNRAAGMITCDDEEVDASLLNPATTKLRVSAVKKLARGKTTSASGSVAMPPTVPGATGGETLHYTLRIERVR
jgi:hypothetical protein